MSAEAPRGNQGCLPRFLRRLFASPQDLQPTQQTTEQPRSLNQLLDELDHSKRVGNERREGEAREVVRKIEAEALQKSRDEVKALETSVKAFLVIADPLITEGLSDIGRRSFGDGKFIIIKSGGGLDKRGQYKTFEIIGVSPITDIKLFDPEEAEMSSIGGAEFEYRVQSTRYNIEPKRRLSDYDILIRSLRTSAFNPDESYYLGALKFSKGKPYSLQFGYGTTLYGEELEKIGQNEALNNMLIALYHRGPESADYVGGEGW